jgi:hypothetical protein
VAAGIPDRLPWKRNLTESDNGSRRADEGLHGKSILLSRYIPCSVKPAVSITNVSMPNIAVAMLVTDRVFDRISYPRRG